ncbi:hypothetical protein VTL71DRAFT_15408 [Oculimacula yallundae]|uniref:Ankyrin repeat protein n=1 Tax=Oculimacula yallundae TaxID=86028 RepID=A0ABR4CH39_9HELO
MFFLDWIVKSESRFSIGFRVFRTALITKRWLTHEPPYLMALWNSGNGEDLPDVEGHRSVETRTEKVRQQPLSVLRAFIRQLSVTLENDDDILVRKQLKQYYDETLQAAFQPIDALDYLVEYTKPEALKIFISGRPDGNILWRLGSRDSIRIGASDNRNDISKFVKEELLRYRHPGRLSAALKDQIISTIQGKSQGMFQWAFLQINQLLELDLAEDIEARLGKLPTGLKTAYDEIINRMPELYRKIAYNAIQWVMCACHPLFTEILLPAVCQDEKSGSLIPLGGLSESLLLEYCHSLLVIDPIRKIWVTSYLSVNEYFENYVRNPESSNKRMKDRLETFLGILEDSSPAYRSWHRMISKDGLRAPESSLLRKPKHVDLNDFLLISAVVLGYCRLGISALLPNWHNCEWMSSQLKDSKKRSLLELVCISGELGLCENFVEHTAEVNLQSESEYGSALAAAAYHGNLAMIRFLIQAGAQVNMQLSHGQYGSALAAAVAGHQGRKTVEFLIKAGANVNMQFKFGGYGSVLAAAAVLKEVEIMNILIEAGAEVNMQLQYCCYGSALASVAARGKDRVIELLLKAGAYVNIRLGFGENGSALAAAAAWGSKGNLGVLIRAGADVNQLLYHGSYGSALAAAATARVDTKEKLPKRSCGSALAVAAFLGSADSGGVERLIAAGADINIRLIDGTFPTALAAARFRLREAQKASEIWEKEKAEGPQGLTWTLAKSRELECENRYGIYEKLSNVFEAEKMVQLLLRSGAEDSQDPTLYSRNHYYSEFLTWRFSRYKVKPRPVKPQLDRKRESLLQPDSIPYFKVQMTHRKEYTLEKEKVGIRTQTPKKVVAFRLFGCVSM